MDNLCSKAIAILEDSDARFYVDMTEALRSGRACAVLADEDGVLIHVPDCIWYMMAKTEARAVFLARHVAANKTGSEQLVCHDNVALEKCAQIVGQRVLSIPVMLFGYFSETLFDVPECFSLIPSEEKDMFDGYVDGAKVGYIGIREEGTIGHLEALQNSPLNLLPKTRLQPSRHFQRGRRHSRPAVRRHQPYWLRLPSSWLLRRP